MVSLRTVRGSRGASLATALTSITAASYSTRTSNAVPPAADHLPTMRLRIDFHSHRLPTPAVYAASPRQNTPRLPSHPQPAPSSPPTPSSGPSSAKASWSSILSAASYRNLLGGGGPGTSASGTKRSKGTASSDPRRTSTTDEIALANGSITPEVAAAIMEIRRRRTANAEYAKTITDSPTPTAAHPKARSNSMHSQVQPVKISQSAALSSFRRLPLLSQPVVPKVPLKPVKIQATFHDVPMKEIM
jgi:hypothetical protein